MDQRIPGAAAAQAQLAKILASPGFRNAGHIGPLLAYLVEKTLAGETGSLKESVLGIEVFGRPASYDPRVDPIVQVETRRLRARLDEYYAANPRDPVRIELPKVGYVPMFAAHEMEPAAQFSQRPHLSGPALVFLIVTAVSFSIGVFVYFGKQSNRREPPAIAVLPFRNLSPDPGSQYFTDGLTIELIDALTRIESLRVISWNTAERFRGKAASLPELRTELNAGAVLDGAVRQADGKVRVTAQLVDTGRGATLWSQTWEREDKDIFRIQEELAKSIVYGLRVQMSADPDQVIAPARTADPRAYEDYLRARFYRNRFSEEGMRLSSEYARKSMERDPAFAPACALLASNIVIGGYYGHMPAAESARQAKDLAGRALRSDPKSAEGNAALGLALAMGEWRFEEASQYLRKAVELNPGSADAHSALALGYLLPTGKVEEAGIEVRKALRLDPLSFWSNMLAGFISQQIPGREAEALPYYDRGMEIYPDFRDLVWDRGMALAFSGRKEDALASFRRSGEIRGRRDWSPGPVEYALLGDKANAMKTAAEQRHLGPLELARTYAMVGEKELAIAELGRAYEERDRQLMFIQIDRRLASLRGDARFEALAAKVMGPR